MSRLYHPDWFTLIVNTNGWIVKEFIKSLEWERSVGYVRKAERLPKADLETGEVWTLNKAVFEPLWSYSKHRENIYTPFHIYPLVRSATPPKTLVSARADCTPSGHCSVGDF